MVVFFI